MSFEFIIIIFYVVYLQPNQLTGSLNTVDCSNFGLNVGFHLWIAKIVKNTHVPERTKTYQNVPFVPIAWKLSKEME